MTDPWQMLEKASLRGEAMAKAFGALQGHVMNAIIDLETGTKADALRTLRAGQKIVAEYQASLTPPPLFRKGQTMTKTCESDAEDWFDDDHDCANCGGEGFTYGCSWDWQCATYDEGEGTCLCTRNCDWCSPHKPTPESEAMRQMLADALHGEHQPKEQSHD